MKKISNIFKKAKANHQHPVLSFEIFPPQGKLSIDSALDTVAQLSDLCPDYVSVTYSAAGSGNSGATADVAALLQDSFDTTALAHLTCAKATKESLNATIDDLKAKGIANVLALRGDLAKGQEPNMEFPCAKDLISVLKEHDFCVGAAAYPEGHPTEFDTATSLDYLKQKQDAGADFFVTQLFYDNDVFYRFWEQALANGIEAPITCGVMPFMSKKQVQRMVFMCGVSLPSGIVKLLTKYEDDKESLLKAGIEYAAQQLVDLSEHGVDGLHLYTMNRPVIAHTATELLRASWAN